MDWFKRKKAKAASQEERLAFSETQDFSFQVLLCRLGTAWSPGETRGARMGMRVISW